MGIKPTPIAPFLRWAGGKRWLTASYFQYFPKKFGRYYEPFLGSGAVFFRLAPNRATLSDANSELIHCFQGVRDAWESVERILRTHHTRHSPTYYESVRKSKPRNLDTRSARFIYLNRTCWNALYRVNLKGEFNVPIGTKSNVILDSDNFESIALQLKGVTLSASDFEKVVNRARSGDFVFADPPYTVKHNLNGFVKYNEKIFRWDDQIRLSECLRRAADRGVLVLTTNANHPSIVELYKDHFSVTPVIRRSVIAARSEYRGYFDELIISNYPHKSSHEIDLNGSNPFAGSLGMQQVTEVAEIGLTR